MMQKKSVSNLVVKTVCELNIQVKSYCEKTSVKNHVFTLSLFLTYACGGCGWQRMCVGAQRMQRTRRGVRQARISRQVPGLRFLIGSLVYI